MWDAIIDGSIYSCPSLLASFLILSYADLKKYKFHHLFAFPAFISSPTWKMSAPVERLDAHQTSSLVESVNTWRYRNDSRQRGFFLVKRVEGAWEVASLGQFEQGFFGEDLDFEDKFVAFVDSSDYADSPAWPLRNLLVLVRKRWGWNKVRVLCYRDSHIGRHEPRSIVLNLELDTEEELGSLSLGDEMPKMVGWEKNADNKIYPRVANLSAQMDPKMFVSHCPLSLYYTDGLQTSGH